MPIKSVVVFLFLTLSFSIGYAQTQKEFSGPLPKSPPSYTTEEQPHQKDIYTHHKSKGFKWKRGKVTHSAQYEFYKRVELAAKEHQRMLKKLHEPQYSNFLYYGHKRKPKKHSPDKMKYCKECGIRH